MPESRTCRKCATDVPTNAPFGLCPQCLLAMGFGPVPKEALEPTEEPTAQSALGDAQSAIGTVRYFGDYELLEQIGRGGMGVVFKARQISLRRLVALKMISAGKLASPTAVQRFRIEAEAAAKLDHPNIVPIFEIGVHEGHHYFSMKLVEGGNLEEMIRRLVRPHPSPLPQERERDARSSPESCASPRPITQRTRPEWVKDHEPTLCAPSPGGEGWGEGERKTIPFSIRDSADLLAKVARAIHYAHQHGVIHRDLKPGNILLDAEGQPHVTDFGLAKILEHEIGVTRTAELLGTPSYMSPEQAAGRQLSTSTDLWSLGAILYEMLAGRPPFGAENTPALLRKIAEEDPVPPSKCEAGSARYQRGGLRLPRPARHSLDLETICLKCLEKDPARRYASAAALVDDLEHWLRDEPIQARRATLFERVTKWARRQPVLAAAVVVLHLVLGLGLAGVLWQWRQADEARRETTHSNEHLRQALNQMDSIQLQRAEEYFAEENRLEALSRWALVLRNNPSNRIAAERLMSTLSHRNWARLACPPLEHSNRVTHAEFSRDGTRVVTSSADNTACVWDATTGKRVAGPFMHAAEINEAKFSPDGRWVVTASQDKTARVWDVLTGQPVTPPLQHSNDVTTAQFNPAGMLILTTSGELGQLWNARTGQREGPAQVGSNFVFGARFSPDGSRVALACADGHGQVWEVASGTCLHRLQHRGHIWSLEFSPDGIWLATASDDKTVQVWDVESGQPVGATLQHQGRVWGVEFSPDSQRIVTASRDHTAQVWDVRTGGKIGDPLRHDDAVRSAMFSPEGLRVVTASGDKTVRVWDAITGEPLTEPMRHDRGVFGAQFSPDGERVLTACNEKAVLIWQVIGTAALTFQVGADAGVVKFSPDGKRLAVASFGSHTRVWDPLTGQPVTPPFAEPPKNWINDVTFSPDSRLVATACTDGGSRVSNAHDGSLVARTWWAEVKNRHPGLGANPDAYWVAFSPDGKLLLLTINLVAGTNHFAAIWDVQSGKLLRTIVHEARLSQPSCFSPDGTELLTITEAAVARVWKTHSGEPVTPPMAHAATITSAQFSPDGRYVLTAVGDASFFIWDKSTGRQLAARWPHRGRVGSAFYSHDGKRVLTFGREYGAQIWDLAAGASTTGEFGKQLHAGDSSAPTVVIGHDHDRILIGYRDKKYRERTSQFWDATSGQRLSEALPDGDGISRWRQCSQDGRLVAVSSSGGRIRISETPPAVLPVQKWLPELAEALAGQRFNKQGMLETVRPAELWAIQQKIAAWITAHDLESSRTPTRPADAFYARWAKWFLADARTRTVLPSSPLKLPDYAYQLNGPGDRVAEALKLQPTNGLHFIRLAYQDPLSPQADWRSRRATELMPGEFDSWWTRGYVLMRTNRLTEALQMMERASELEPTHAGVWNSRGTILEQMGRLEEAKAAFTKATELGRKDFPPPPAPTQPDPGFALHFNDSGSYVAIPHTTGLNAFPLTLTAWIKTSARTESQGLVNKYSGGSHNGWSLFLHLGHVHAWYFADLNQCVWGGGAGMDGGFVADGAWHQVTFTVDATSGRLYLDGVLKASRAWKGAPGAATTTQEVRLGSSPGASFNGSFSLDEVSVWRVALSQSQIVSNLFTKLTGKEADLLALYHCEEGSGPTVADAAPLDGSNEGAWVGTPRFVPTMTTSKPAKE